MNQRRVLFAGMLAIAAGALLFSLHRMDEGRIEAVEGVEVAPRYTLLNTEWTRFDDAGQETMTGVAETIVYYSDESGHATNIVVDVLDMDRGPWKLAAPTAVMPARQHRIELLGNVDVAGQWPDNGDALRARTDQVWVDPDLHRINTEAPMEVVSRSRSGTAVGMEADWDKNTLNLLHDVKMTYRGASR